MRRVIALLLMLSFTLFSLVAAPASADDISSTKGFRNAVTLEGVREHQAALQQIADLHGGVRAAGGAGHEASADYAAQGREPRNKLRFVWLSASEGNAGAALYVNARASVTAPMRPPWSFTGPDIAGA